MGCRLARKGLLGLADASLNAGLWGVLLTLVAAALTALAFTALCGDWATYVSFPLYDGDNLTKIRVIEVKTCFNSG